MEPNSKGSVLAYSLIILSVMLMIAISLSAVTLTQTKGALTGQNSSQAFQTADSGVQVVLKKIEKASPTANVNSIGCSDGKISGTLSAGTYEVQLYKYDSTAGADIAMSDCSAKIEEITKIKSVGKYAGTARAVEVAVAAGGLAQGAWCGAGERIHNSSLVEYDAGISHHKCEGKDVVKSNGDVDCPSGYSSFTYSTKGSSAPYERLYITCVKG